MAHCWWCAAELPHSSIYWYDISAIPEDDSWHNAARNATPHQYAATTQHDPYAPLPFCFQCSADIRVHLGGLDNDDGEEDDDDDDADAESSEQWECATPDCRCSLTNENAVHYYADGTDYCVSCFTHIAMELCGRTPTPHRRISRRLHARAATLCHAEAKPPRRLRVRLHLKPDVSACTSSQS